VPAELRSPQMAILSVPCTPKTLPIFRGASRLRTNAGRGVTVIKRSIGEPAIRVLLTTPSEGQSPYPAVLWIHGGGYVLGSPQMEAFGTGRLARDLGVVVVSPDYRLAPEHPFPAALDDCMATLRWMRANADGLGIDPDRIAVMGAACTEAVGRAGVRSAGAAPGSDRTATGVGWGRRTRPVPRRGCRVRREAEGQRSSM
jgi:alpha/beta hydrolase fold